MPMKFFLKNVKIRKLDIFRRAITSRTEYILETCQMHVLCRSRLKLS
jgi:hypothetical protein